MDDRTRAVLSHEQEQLWLLHVSQQSSATKYNLAWAVELAGPLDAGALAAALGRVAERHDALRATFHRDGERPVQAIGRADRARLLRTRDLSRLEPAARDAAVERVCRDEPATVFDLEAGPLARGVLLRLESERHLLVWTASELVFDRPSMDLLLAELAAAYRGAPLAPAPPRYADHAAAQREWTAGPEARAAFERWREALRGYGGVELPFERTYSLYDSWLTSEGAMRVMPWPHALAEQAGRFAAAHGVEPLTVLQAAHAALVHRHSGQPDLAIGVRADTRTAATAGVIGAFEGQLPLRLDLGDDPTFAELVRRTARTAGRALDDGRLPYPLIVEAARREGGNDQLPLLMTAVGTGTPPAPVDLGGGLRALAEPLHDGTARLDLTIDVESDAVSSRAVVEWSTKLFSPDNAERLLRRLESTLASGVGDPSRRVSELVIGTAEERELTVVAWNATDLPDAPATIPERFDAQARRTPERVAVADESGAELTYAELRARADGLAHRLAALGAGPEARCGVLMRRDAGLAAGLLAILKAGGAYVPLDPEAPPERLEAILDDAGAALVLTDAELRERVPPGPWRTVLADAEPAPRADAPPDVPLDPANLAYVMYTSGTTGRPKGVLIEHRSVCAFVRGAQELYELTPDDRFVHVAALGFDVSTFDLFGALLTGASVVVASAETRRSLDRLRDLLRERRISVYMGAPGVLELLDPADFPDLRMLAVGGEAFSGDFATRWARGRRFVNSYGPTETTVGVVTKDCAGSWESTPPIGRAMPNHRAYALDRRMQPVPIGVTGELYVGGPGVGRGYLGRPRATAAAFVPDPFSGRPGERLYRTGDLVRWLPSGDLVFLGRADRQLKVSGVRIEPREIEDAICKHPEVRQAVVVPETAPGAPAKLVAYVVGQDGAAPGVSSLRAAVASWLPPNMIPNEWVAVDAVPLTPAGKVDAAALAAARDRRAHEPAAPAARPRTETERRVAEEVFEPVLGRQGIGVDEGFFELGGHSLQALSVLARTRSLFGVEIRVAQFFQVPTIAGVAAAVDAGRADALATADRDALLDALSRVERLEPTTAAGTEA
ncbi:MAG TPA: amino acid adenylation domain-containing protein [Solirubrobacteraceae bacterium]|jgi:amino acid adenylation domain-containing protein|nr:amino acid adenylation domain-containing protein [Solirubrobacteraceae bacterium]